jgi:hypothetical protein
MWDGRRAVGFVKFAGFPVLVQFEIKWFFRPILTAEYQTFFAFEIAIAK